MVDNTYERNMAEHDELHSRSRTGEYKDGSSSHHTRRRSNERGFASMDPDKQREIASKGGRAAHKKGTAHEFSSEEARAAGLKGGEKVSQNREHMSQIGSRGGRASHDREQDDEE